MPCAPTHRLINFTVTAAYLACRPTEQQNGIAHPLVGASATALLASLPDAIEPPLHPNHRQFFHSITFACIVGLGVYRAYHWQTETAHEGLLRTAVLVCGSAYLLHLLADVGTARSLPLLGK
jgi:inner membrane protein